MSTTIVRDRMVGSLVWGQKGIPFDSGSSERK